MNIVSNHNRLLRGAAIPTAGGDVYNSGWEYTPEGEISGYSGSAIYTGEECPCDSAAIVDSAFNKSTAWVDEQNYLTEHQDVSNLPYVQNSALEFNGELISGISGSGFFAAESERAISATIAQATESANVSESAKVAESAQIAEFATSSLSSNRSDVANYAFSADMVINGWEYDETSAITAYNGSALKAGDYSGISPIVVDNVQRIISAESARLGIQDPLYFVEDSNTATVIGIHDSAFPTFEGTEDGKISAINGSAINAASVVEYSAGNNIDITNHVISVTGSVPSADRASTANTAYSATYDSSGNNIANTYLKVTSYKEYSAGPNIDITNHVISGRDWDGYIRNIVQSGDATAYNAATAWVYNQGYLTGNYIPVSAMGIDTPMPGMLTYITGFSGSGISARVAAESFTALKDSDGRSLTALLANSAINSADGYVTGINGTPISGVGGQGVEYEGIAPIVVNNVEHKISAQSAKLGVQEPLYFVEDSNTATIIGISGLPEVEGVMYESGLGLQDGYITGYNGSALSSERSRYAVSSTSANGAISSQTAAIVTGGWETANGKITGYNGTAINAGGSNPQVPVSGVSGISIEKVGGTVLIGMSANATGKYIPYTNISTGDSGTTVYNVASGIRVTAASGWVEMYNQNKENENEAHLQVGQNYEDGHSFWGEFDGAGGGFLQMNWNSGTIGPNSHSSYSDGTCSSIGLFNGALVYRSANSALTSFEDDEASKVWQLGSERLRLWNSHGSASFGPTFTDVVNTDNGCYWSLLATDSATRLRIYGSAGDGTRGAVDITPGYINFYNDDWSLNQTLNTSDISALKALPPIRIVSNTADATGSNILYVVTGS